MMSKKADNLQDLVEGLGLDPEQASIFLHLNWVGVVSALQVSRDLKLPRTTVYRLLESLINKGLVNTLEGELGTVYEAVSPEQLNKLKADKEIELVDLAVKLATLIPKLEEQRGLAIGESKVVHYRGSAGLRQLIWNTLAAKDELCILERSTFTNYLGQAFAEKVRTEYALRKIHTRQITNETSFPGWTNVKDFLDNYWQIKYLPPEQLEIKFEVFIYNDIYTLLKYDGGEIFGVEIHNHDLALMQKQLFQNLWNQAQDFEVLDQFGAAAVAKVVVE
jgi:sugar-specific transcriptional regulator TrmB